MAPVPGSSPPPTPPAPAAAAPPMARTADAPPTGLRRFLRVFLPWALSLALVLASWALTRLQKDDDAIYDSFVTHGVVGEQARARNIDATITDVHVARSVSDGDRWQADGTWIVVDVDAAAVQTQTAALLRAQLRVGPRTYSATERGETAINLRLIPGVAKRGSVAFEVPADVPRKQATVVLSWHRGDDADGVIEVAVDLGEIPIEERVVLDEIGWAQ